MAIKGTALLALCTLLGAALGEGLGRLSQVRANVGGVGIAMLLLIAARGWLGRRGLLTPALTLGVEFWAVLYIPIVVAMAAQQNVREALSGGPLVAATGIAVVTTCFVLVGLVGRAGRHDPLVPQDSDHV